MEARKIYRISWVWEEEETDLITGDHKRTRRKIKAASMISVMVSEVTEK